MKTRTPVKWLLRLVWLSFFGLTALAASAKAEGARLALVIGNANYQNLPAAIDFDTNAERMGAALRQLGFTVSLSTNDSAVATLRQIAEFGLQATGAGSDPVLFVYFAGRTATMDNRTFLLPSDTAPATNVASTAIPLDQALALVNLSGGAAIVVLDTAQPASFELKGAQQGVGTAKPPLRGMIATVARRSADGAGDEATDSFVNAFESESLLPNILLEPFIQFVAETAKAISDNQIDVALDFGEPTNVVLNRNIPDSIARRLIQLRVRDLERAADQDEIAAFVALYPENDRAAALLQRKLDETLSSTTISETEISRPQASGTDDTAPPILTPELVAALEAELVRPVLFTSPLSGAGQEIDGRTLEELIKASPLYPPIEGLPKELWAQKSCLNCHQWDREILCEHGGRYQGAIWASASTKVHPLGGGFKRAIRAWAADGCQ